MSYTAWRDTAWTLASLSAYAIWISGTAKSMASEEPLYITDVQIKLEHVASIQMVRDKADCIGLAAPS